MKRSSITTRICRTAFAAGIGALAGATLAATPLADQPVFSSASVPGNLALALSVEWPTVSRAAHPSTTYSSANTYRGYFDHNKCYRYVHVATETATSVSRFDPVGLASDRQCPATGVNGDWSGNFLNWATMIAVDPFRWALTGGLRKVDEVGTTILERARHSGQGNLFPHRTINNATTISNATPFTWGSLTVRTDWAGTRLIFTSGGSVGNENAAPPASTHYSQADANGATVYHAEVRVKVCDPAFLESNCRQYSATNWKPEGLIQEYSDRMRYSAFGYLNDPSMLRDGGVLRAAQKFVGPMMPVPGAPDAASPRPEWNPATGVFYSNPDSADAAATGVSNSGVINYLNKFGQLTTNNHKDHDPVSELFYAVTRYFRNQGNVPAWTDMSSSSAANQTRFIDGFPVITDWKDPIEYSCQRNFVLGIGDIYTHRDKNLPGSGTGTTDEPTKPSQVGNDTVDSVDIHHQGLRIAGARRTERHQLQRPEQFGRHGRPRLPRQHPGPACGSARQADHVDLLGRRAGSPLRGEQPVLPGRQVRRLRGAVDLRRAGSQHHQPRRRMVVHHDTHRGFDQAARQLFHCRPARPDDRRSQPRLRQHCGEAEGHHHLVLDLAAADRHRRYRQLRHAVRRRVVDRRNGRQRVDGDRRRTAADQELAVQHQARRPGRRHRLGHGACHCHLQHRHRCGRAIPHRQPAIAPDH